MLRHNSVGFSDDSSKQDLLDMIQQKIVGRLHDEEDWKPPDSNSLDWNDAVSLTACNISFFSLIS